ncbi:hypothetical protein AMTR_s00014p00229580 [Amborella trichopoda]|uniref:RPA43 OB domain-containing protein n=1 Tax=Amborella trichopoda TaxID=13333 RepID=W1PN98_AMBTC|nr:hypothetical protein AMTR_s00014p00229580 [Amborella trichopoda]
MWTHETKDCMLDPHACIRDGMLNKLGNDYIGVIVLGIFNAAIAITDIREEFHYERDEDGEPIWVSTDHRDHVIRT